MFRWLLHGRKREEGSWLWNREESHKEGKITFFLPQYGRREQILSCVFYYYFNHCFSIYNGTLINWPVLIYLTSILCSLALWLFSALVCWNTHDYWYLCSGLSKYASIYKCACTFPFCNNSWLIVSSWLIWLMYAVRFHVGKKTGLGTYIKWMCMSALFFFCFCKCVMGLLPNVLLLFLLKLEN